MTVSTCNWLCNTFSKEKEIGGYYGSRTKDNVAS